MGDLVTPDDLPNWVPGEVTVDSSPLEWQGDRVRGYRYTPWTCLFPDAGRHRRRLQGRGDDHE